MDELIAVDTHRDQVVHSNLVFDCVNEILAELYGIDDSGSMANDWMKQDRPIPWFRRSPSAESVESEVINRFRIVAGYQDSSERAMFDAVLARQICNRYDNPLRLNASVVCKLTDLCDRGGWCTVSRSGSTMTQTNSRLRLTLRIFLPTQSSLAHSKTCLTSVHCERRSDVVHCRRICRAKHTCSCPSASIGAANWHFRSTATLSFLYAHAL